MRYVVYRIKFGGVPSNENYMNFGCQVNAAYNATAHWNEYDAQYGHLYEVREEEDEENS